MAKKLADAGVVALIRTLASDPGRVEVYRSAKYDFLSGTITKDDVCDAVCAWIDAGEPVLETIIHTIPELQGHPAYELKPQLAGHRYYVKLAMEKRGEDWLLILSVHLDV
jgi:hypothetical protein